MNKIYGKQAFFFSLDCCKRNINLICLGDNKATSTGVWTRVSRAITAYQSMYKEYWFITEKTKNSYFNNRIK